MASKFGLASQRWRDRPVGRKIFDIIVWLFALVGFGVVGAWGFYQLGFTKDRGAQDRNYRYMLSVDEMKSLSDSVLTTQQVQERWMRQYVKLAAFSKFYPTNAQLITQAAQFGHDPMHVDRMLAACSMYIEDLSEYNDLLRKVEAVLSEVPQRETGNVIPWMADVEWQALREAIVRDKALIIEAGRLTGVEPRLIVGCLIGEQIRLFNAVAVFLWGERYQDIDCQGD